MAKKSISGSNGGVLGSGIFGLFGTVINCDSTDNSLYCTIMKIFNLLIVFLVVVYILYIVHMLFIKPLLKIKGRR
jgi:hypothetical protein